MYLWLNCEGWVRFGPFAWLRFDDNPRVIRDQDGSTVASFDGTDWRTPDEKYSKFQWRNPMVTSSARHPHPNHG
jgi:hypothetical protein